MTFDDIQNMKIGLADVSAAYIGTIQVYPSSTPAPHDYSQDYFTVETLSGGTFIISLSGSVTGSSYLYASQLGFSVDDGQTWSGFTSSGTTSSNRRYTATVNANPGTKILLKGRASRLSGSGSNSHLMFNSGGTIPYKIYGNIASLFSGYTTFSAVTSPLMCISGFAGSNMMVDASNLILPSTALSESCYGAMFSGCTSLTTAPTLPATTLADRCYQTMFQGCTSLTTAPELPATTLARLCYNATFADCTSLTTAPELPATTLADYCYYGMFRNCTGLTTSPTSIGDSATTFVSGSCGQMFQGCTSLTEAPVLSGTILEKSSCVAMFSGCTNLSAITCMVEDVSASACTDWVLNVSATGVFTKSVYNNNFEINSKDGIPIGWTIVNADETPWNPSIQMSPSYYMSAQAVSASTIGLKQKSTYQTVYFSKNLQTWQQVNAGDVFTLSGGETIYVCGNLTRNNSSSNYTQFVMIGYIEISDYISGIWNSASTGSSLYNFCGYYMFSDCTGLHFASTAPQLPHTSLSDRCYQGMFNNCTSLTDASGLLLSATTVNTYGYAFMFAGCTSLTGTPTLSATTLGNASYNGMFAGCTSLTTAPALPAMTLDGDCYNALFQDCTGLTTPPSILPATTLASRCYINMFRGCTSLTTAPELPATTLESYCYYYMFYNCNSLNSITCLAEDISANQCTYGWLSNVASGGTFTKASGTSWSTGTSGIPSNWTVVNYQG